MSMLRWAALPLVLVAMPAWADSIGDKPKKPKPICRSEAHTGSRLATSTCHTAEEWEAIDAAEAANAKGMLDDVSKRVGQQGIRSGSTAGPFGG